MGEDEPIDNITGKQWHKCTQKDTIQRIFTLWQENTKKQEEFQKEMIERDKKLKEAFDNCKESITNLRNELDNRKLINNFNEKEKIKLEELLHDQGKTDVDIYTKVNRIDKRLVGVEETLPTVIKTVEDTAKKYDRLFWLLVAFFILFMVKTFIWGY